MKLSLIWESNDHLLFDVINEDLAYWFVETSDRLGNKWNIADQITDVPLRSNDISKLISEINHAIDRVNAFFIKMKQQPINKPTNWFDQNQLNTLHKDWAQTRKLWPKLPEMLFKIDKSLFDCYQQMNCHIHLIEKASVYSLRDETNWRVNNPFKDTFFNWKQCHLSIEYPGHGRNAFEKFQNYDINLDDIEIDNCNWDNIDAYIQFDFRRPYNISPPEDFLAWCHEKSLVPHTHSIPLANLSDWQNNTTLSKEIFHKNMNITNNYAKLEII